jgi:nucleotide-binding universal stress UspA family protein
MKGVPMYETILVPLDGSELGEQALPIAVSLAQALDARLILVRAAWVQTPVIAGLEEMQLAAVREAETYLATIATRLADTGAAIETGVPYEPVVDGILLEIGLRRADLVVMTTHGRSGLGRWIYGSVAEAILRRSPVPVLLVRATDQVAPALIEQRHPKLLVPLDGSRYAEAAIPHAEALARRLEGSVVVIHVHEPPIVTAADIYGHPEQVEKALLNDETAVQEYLSGVAHHFREAGIPVHTVIGTGTVVQGILEESWSSGASLIVMTTHGRTGLARVVFGGVALELVRQGATPVFLVRPKGLRDHAPVAAGGIEVF